MCKYGYNNYKESLAVRNNPNYKKQLITKDVTQKTIPYSKFANAELIRSQKKAKWKLIVL